jgi:GWxTD domain-containing protein
MRRSTRWLQSATLLVLVTLGRPEAVAQQPAAALHPGIGEGDFEFVVDVAGLHPASEGRVVTRVLVQLPSKPILTMSHRNEIDLRLSVRVYDAETALAMMRETAGAEGRREQAAEADRARREALEDFGGVPVLAQEQVEDHLRADDVGSLRDTDFSLLPLSLELAPGDYVFDVVLENLSKSKSGLLDRMRNKPTRSKARLLVRVPDLGSGVALADPVFQSGHVRLNQYPARVYGLLNDSLHVSTTVFATGPTRLHTVVTDREGKERWQDSLEVDVAGRRQVSFHTSVNTLPAGQYVLTVWAENDAGRVRTQRSFDVAWSLASWHKSYRDRDLEAAIVLSEADYSTYRSLSTGEKEHFMDNFWAEHDPTPGTATNEVLQVFQGRVAFADEHFSETVRGALSDRGKVFIRFGPPNEIQEEAVPSHLAGTGSEDLIAKVEDPYMPSLHEPMQEDLVINESFAGQQVKRIATTEHQRVVGVGRELVSYELWIYAGGGQPLFDNEAINLDTGLRVLFIDTQGFGQFKLRKSSAKLPIQGLGATF